MIRRQMFLLSVSDETPMLCRPINAAMAALAFVAAVVSAPATSGHCQAESLPWIRVSPDGTHFVQGESSTRFQPMGFNYDHDADGRLIEDYWHLEWERVADDFRNMKSLGANVVRIHLQFGRFMNSPAETNAAELQQLARLLQLAEDTRLYLDLTGLGCYHKKDMPTWYDALDEQARWKAQQVFWSSVSEVCKDSSAVFCYDLMNEPVIGGETESADWLGPAFAGKHFVQFVARTTKGRTRPEVAKQWIEAMVSAIRQIDSRHLVTVGLVDWSLDRPGLTSGFVPQKVTEKLDFLAIHLYPKASKVDEALETLRGFQIGKPVIVEETFPLSCSLDEMDSFMDRSHDQCAGWISFFWGKMPEEYDAKNSIADAITSQWLARFSTRMTSLTVAETSSKEDHERVEIDAIISHFADHSRTHSDGRAAFSVDLSSWSGDTTDLPIGVFDSGIGGLTVQEAIFGLDAFHNETFAPGADGVKDFQHERFVYFGDQANMPYGHYPSVQRQNFLKELILKDAAFLLGSRYWSSPTAETPTFDKPPVKALVIACNTATAWGMDEIRQLAEAWKIPVFVIGVVEAGARGVTETLPSSSDDRHGAVAVLATVGTCGSNAYPKAIGRTAGLAGRRVPEVIQQGCVGLAGAIEGDPGFVPGSESKLPYLGPSAENAQASFDFANWSQYGFETSGLLGDKASPSSLRLNSVTNYVRYDVTTLVKNHKASGSTTPIETVVLGCTHFPLVRQEILDAFARLRNLDVEGQQPYRDLISESLTIVDPAELTARELFRELARRKQFRKATPRSVDHTDQFFMSVANPRCAAAKLNAERALDHDYKYSRDPMHLDVEDTICVPMTMELLPASSIQLIQSKLPEVWSRLRSSQQ